MGRVKNFDYIKYYFGDEMKEAEIDINDNLIDFVNYNTRNLNFDYYQEKNEEVKSHIMFTNIYGSLKQFAYFDPAAEKVYFGPDSKFDILDFIKLHGTVTHEYIFKGNDGVQCHKEKMSDKGYYIERYNTSTNKIVTSIYSYKDTIKALEKSKEDDYPMLSDTSYMGFPLLSYKIKKTANIEASLDDGKVNIVMTDYDGKIIDSRSFKLRDKESFYEEYSSYLEIAMCELHEIIGNSRKKKKSDN